MRKVVRTCTRLIGVAVLVALSACGPSSSNGGKDHSAASTYPQGIVPLKSGASAVRAGVYPGRDSAHCCFIAPHAKLLLDKPEGTRFARFRFYVPKFAPYAGKETVTVRADGQRVAGSNVPAKWIAVSLLLPARDMNKTSIPVDIVASKSFVPKQLGMSADTRDLSVVLTTVEYR